MHPQPLPGIFLLAKENFIGTCAWTCYPVIRSSIQQCTWYPSAGHWKSHVHVNRIEHLRQTDRQTLFCTLGPRPKIQTRWKIKLNVNAEYAGWVNIHLKGDITPTLIRLAGASFIRSRNPQISAEHQSRIWANKMQILNPWSKKTSIFQYFQNWSVVAL